MHPNKSHQALSRPQPRPWATHIPPHASVVEVSDIIAM